MNRTALFSALLALAIFSPAARAAPDGASQIAIVVNQDAITMDDVNDRLRLILTSSGLPDTPEIRSKLMPQIVGALVEEQIKFQEAAREDLAVTRAEIDEGFAQIARQNNFEPDQFRQILSQSKLSIPTMEAQIKSQIAWAKIVQKKLRPQVIVSDSDIDTHLERLNASLGKTEYLVSEIFLPVEGQKNLAQVQGLANGLAQEIKAGKAPFFKVAQQFSQSAGASGGGNLGWIQQGQLAPELDAVLPQVGSGQISDPVKTPAGYHILLVREQRTLSAENMPSREQIMTQIGTERLERQARRYLMDLKSSAFIDNRLGS